MVGHLGTSIELENKAYVLKMLSMSVNGQN